MKRTLSLAIALIPSFALAQTLTVTGGKADARNVVVRAPLPDGMKIEGNIVAGDDRSSYFLVAKAGLMSNDEPTEYLTFLLTELKAGEIVTKKRRVPTSPRKSRLPL